MSSSRYTLAIFAEEPIACEGDDLVYESFIVTATSQAQAIGMAREQFPTSYVFLWQVDHEH